ncbi:MAG: phytoene/squalene synthase family protein [Bacteroidota bacterium]|nr:phytoene/squalene synthase family protein [Bacteroidota bacterium]
MEIYDNVAFECGKIITHRYSTSFTLGIKTLNNKFHSPIYAIYGFVRSADEIVDSFHEYDKEALFKEFRESTNEALEKRISINPVLQGFQIIFHKYNIGLDLVNAFLDSMEMDLYHNKFSLTKYEEYIYGSAEVVGLMCLKVFCEGNSDKYERLKEPARSLGAAFQKVNFLRDMKSDFDERGRVYFPGVDFEHFDYQDKSLIEEEIQHDFDAAYKGILKLPEGSKMGVYLAYIYYLQLFKKIKNCPAAEIKSQRIRIPDNEKLLILLESYFRHRFNFL